MQFLIPPTSWFAVLATAFVGYNDAHSESPKALTADKAIQRGLAFLQADAVKWRKDRDCSTCHHGTMTVFAFQDAKRQGFKIDANELAEMGKWTKERLLAKVDQPRDTRPGWSMMSTPALYLSLMALTVPKQDAISAEEQKKIVGHLLRHQEADGSWAWSSAPLKNRPPPFFESDEVATLLAYAVLRPHMPADPKQKSDVRDARTKAAAWLAKTKPTDTTQAVALRLLVLSEDGAPSKAIAAAIDQFLTRQHKDGGWSQLTGATSDAYATGQALFVLSLVGVKNDRAEVNRAVKFLVETQKEDGSWPMTARSHPGADPAKNAVPIIYFGSAWGTIGLVRSTKQP